MRKIIFTVCMAVYFIASFTTPSHGEKGRSWRIFNVNENTWVWQPKGLMLFSTLSRTVKPVVIDPVRQIDTLSDCSFYEGYLWISCNAGIYQIDASNQSVERISLPPSDSAVIGKIGQDADYLWLGTASRLMRFDKLGREWLSFELPRPVERMVGVWSDGTEVFCLGNGILYRFTASTEKWNSYPLERTIGIDAVFYPGENAFKVVDGRMVMQYEPESFSWTLTDLGSDTKSIFDEDTVIYYTDGKDVRKLSCKSGVIKTVNIPNPGVIDLVAKYGDTLVLTSEKRIAKYSIAKETMNFTEYDGKIDPVSIEKTIPLKLFFILFSDNDIAIYEKETRAWHHLPRSGLRQKAKVFSWNEQECALRYAPGYQSSISGSMQSGVTFDWDGYSYDTTFKYRFEVRDTGTGSMRVFVADTIIDSEPQIRFGEPNFLGDINLHSSDRNDRIADIFLNNSNTVAVPKKGLYYRGNRDDRLNSIRIGTTSSEQIVSPLKPEASMEGGSAIIESKAWLSTKDRKVVRLSGGTGYMTTKTVTKIVPYSPDGKYKFSASPQADSSDTAGGRDTLGFVLGSCRVYVDGEEIDPSMYNFYYSTGVLSFNTMAPVDPGSIIMVEYKVQTLPEGDITDLELIPSHRFGKLSYGALTYSPKDWISAQIGYTGVDRDSLNSIVDCAVPLELRNAGKRVMLLFRPELLYNVDRRAFAGGAELKSRIGDKTGIVVNALMVGSDFVSTDELSRGYGKKRGEYDALISHDILQELPLSYYQHQRFGENGVESRYSFSAGARFTGLPFLEANLSRTVISKDERLKDSVTAIDDLFHLKDKLKLRLFESSSAFLERLARFYKISYDLTYAENRTQAFGSGQRNSGRLTSFSFLLSPIQRIVLSGELLYRGSMEMEGMPTSDIKPSLSLQMFDAPPGVDVIALNSLKYSRFCNDNFGTDTIERSVSLILKPGKWYAPLGWFSPRAKLTNNVRCRFNTSRLSVTDIFSGRRGIEGNSVSKSAGVNIFPVDEILLINTNEWAQTDSMRTFATLNRIQYNFNASNTYIAEWNYTASASQSKHNGYISYEKLWVPWLRTNATVSSDIMKNDTGSTIVTGPKLLVILNAKNFAFIRNLSNMHDLDVRWIRRNGSLTKKPDLVYTFGLRMKMMPNIELQVKTISFKFLKGVFSDFENSTLLLVYF